MTPFPRSGDDEIWSPRPGRRPPEPLLGRATRIIWIAVAVFALVTAIAWLFERGSDSDEAERQAAALRNVNATSSALATAATPTALPATPTPVPRATLTAQELEQYKPNELGEVMVLMYHYLTYDGGEYSRTPEKFRADLEWLHRNNFYVIPIRDYIRNEINAPAGKRPVVLTFDDGPVSQFRYVTDASGNKVIDPNTMLGIMEEYFTRYPDFGRGGLFSILPLAPFAWPQADDQMPFAEEKLRWLIDHGYEIGNHTVDHIDLRSSTSDEIRAQLAGAVEMARGYDSRAQMEVISVPFGQYPVGGDTTLFEGFDYRGKRYGFIGALMVGAEPAPSPMHSAFDPMWIPRIRADDQELGKWFKFVEENPGIIYVSDGNPDTITIPNRLTPELVGTLKDASAQGKPIIRY